MKRTIIILSIIGILFPGFVLAQTRQGQAASQGNQVQSQNQVETQNQGEDYQLQVETQAQESLQNRTPGERAQIARNNMSAVAEKVEELLTSQGAKGGIGPQVSQFAQAQKQAQSEIGNALNKLEAKSGLMKTIFGPDYKAIKNMKQLMEQNRLRIQQLEQLVNQVQNQADKTQLQETIQTLNEQNTALQEQIQSEEKTGSMFGWLMKFLAGN